MIAALKAQVPELAGRVYQAFLAPAAPTLPYATVKIAGDIADGPRGAAVSVEVRIYAARTSFAELDTIERRVRDALSRRELLDPVEGTIHELVWDAGGLDFDEADDRIGRLVRFTAADVRR